MRARSCCTGVCPPGFGRSSGTARTLSYLCDTYVASSTLVSRRGGDRIGVVTWSKALNQLFRAVALRVTVHTLHSLQPFGTMATQEDRTTTNVKFRVLIIGRANAGKTSILQRVCDTTESEIYRLGPQGTRYQVCSRS